MSELKSEVPIQFCYVQVNDGKPTVCFLVERPKDTDFRKTTDNRRGERYWLSQRFSETKSKVLEYPDCTAVVSYSDVNGIQLLEWVLVVTELGAKPVDVTQEKYRYGSVYKVVKAWEEDFALATIGHEATA